MKQIALVTAAGIWGALALPAAVIVETFDSGFENGGIVPDGSTSPWSDTRTLSGISGMSIEGLSLRLSLSGGCNGDLYGYLSFNGTMAILLDRLGVGTGNAFGYSDAGLNVTFTDAAANNIHFYQAVAGWDITGGAAWQPDGRTINPVTSPPEAFDAAGTATLSSFNGMNPNGNWTLVLSDLAAGGGETKVLSWGLDVTTTAVPEPAGMAIAALMLLAGRLAQRIALKRASKSGLPRVRTGNSSASDRS
jgi:hypothetical protein